MAIREDLVSSAVQFLQDPSVSSSSIENRISFLRSKNLTQEEIDASLARSGGGPPPPPAASPYQAGPPAPYYPPYPPGAWQAPPPPPPRRDWRDWFIMATVAGSVGYGLYAVGKRYVMPLIAPPTPTQLEQDKKTIQDQFDRAFSLVEQLAKDTETLKKAEEQRTEKLDTALADLESVIDELKLANSKRDIDAKRIREEVHSLKDQLPAALENQKKLSDKRLTEINTELGSLKTLLSQRLNSSVSAPSPANPVRPTSSSSGPSGTSVGKVAVSSSENPTEAAASPTVETPKNGTSSTSRSSSTLARDNKEGRAASIPAWQMAFANKNEGSSSSATNGTKDAEASPAS